MQTNPPYPAPGSGPANLPMHSGFLTDWEFTLSCLVLTFGICIILIEYLLLRQKSASVEDVLRTFVVTMIIIGSLFTMTAGFGSAQIAPVIGLFGTIIGYVIGRRSSSGPSGKAGGPGPPGGNS